MLAEDWPSVILAAGLHLDPWWLLSMATQGSSSLEGQGRSLSPRTSAQAPEQQMPQGTGREGGGSAPGAPDGKQEEVSEAGGAGPHPVQRPRRLNYIPVLRGSTGRMILHMDLKPSSSRVPVSGWVRCPITLPPHAFFTAHPFPWLLLGTEWRSWTFGSGKQGRDMQKC